MYLNGTVIAINVDLVTNQRASIGTALDQGLRKLGVCRKADQARHAHYTACLRRLYRCRSVSLRLDELPDGRSGRTHSCVTL